MWIVVRMAVFCQMEVGPPGRRAGGSPASNPYFTGLEGSVPRAISCMMPSSGRSSLPGHSVDLRSNLLTEC